MITFDEFKKIEMKIAQIESVDPHPNADKLYVLGIKIGEARKTIVAGIRKAYSETELQGKKIVVVDNLEPVKVRGVESQAMLLAASEGDTLSLIVPEKPLSDGSEVR